jgi:hypothetical protein
MSQRAGPADDITAAAVAKINKMGRAASLTKQTLRRSFQVLFCLLSKHRWN